MMKRQCGDCQECCTLVAVKGIGKLAAQRCRYQCPTGCSIYSKRPIECRLWSCAWLIGAPVKRPDETHYVIDILPDKIAIQDDDGSVTHLPAVQIWCDPKYPDAHKDPVLRAYIVALDIGVMMVRYGSNRGLVVLQPEASPTGDWFELPSQMTDKLPEEAPCQSPHSH